MLAAYVFIIAHILLSYLLIIFLLFAKKLNCIYLASMRLQNHNSSRESLTIEIQFCERTKTLKKQQKKFKARVH